MARKSGGDSHIPPEFPEGNDTVISKGPCPKCDTEFGNATYADGHAFCFACKHLTPAPRGGSAGSPPDGRGAAAGAGGKDARGDTGGDLLRPEDATNPFRPLDKRNLTKETLKRFGYFVGGFNQQAVQVAPYYDQEGNLACQKLRLPNKEFVVLKAEGAPSITKCRLFGHHTCGDKFDKRVVVTEGEIDAMSVAQAMDFKCAVVSVNGGAQSAAKCLKENYLWLDRFSEIILWFDDDDPGRDAAAECAPLFSVGKVKLARVEGCKDASDVLQRNTPGDITSAVFMATAWRPAGIVNAADREDDVCAPKAEAHNGWHYDWPWTEVQEFLGPILPGQVCYHVAGTGVGKTTGMAEIESHLLTQDCKVGHLGFEDTRRDIKLRLMSIRTEQRLDIKPLSDTKMREIHREVFGSRLVEMFDPETAEWTVDAILGYVRYCAKALDCRVIFIDPLTFIAAGLSLGDDERRALDKASRDLAAISKELQVHLQVAHHLSRPIGTAHEEGASTSLNQVRGSGGIANFASFVIGHERNQQAAGDGWLLTQLRSLKNRPRSKTGPMLVLRYSEATGRLKPTNEVFPGAGKPKGPSPPQDFPRADASDSY